MAQSYVDFRFRSETFSVHFSVSTRATLWMHPFSTNVIMIDMSLCMKPDIPCDAKKNKHISKNHMAWSLHEAGST
jgi:hypothetical protein